MKRFIAVILALALLMSVSVFAESDSSALYAKGMDYLKSQKLDEASSYFRAAGSYSNAATYTYYIKTIKLGLGGLYEEAAKTIGTMYSELECASEYQNYFKALAAIESGNYETAETLLAKLNDFYDSADQKARIADMYKDSKYEEADKYLADGEWNKALAIYNAYNDVENVMEVYYQQAADLMKKYDYTGAVAIYSSILGYKDVVSKLTRAKELAKVSDLFTVGNTITFGEYTWSATAVKKDGNGKVIKEVTAETERPITIEITDEVKKPIEWIVLDVDNGKALLVSKYIIDSQIYATRKTDAESTSDPIYNGDLGFGDDVSDIWSETGEGTSGDSSFVCWRTSYLREWLNSYFIDNAFTESERARINYTNVTAEVNPVYKIEAGMETTDKIFVLSMGELSKYYKYDKNRMAQATPYAVSVRNCVVNEKGYGRYWVRNAGNVSWNIVSVLRDGSYSKEGIICNADYVGVRPAIWVRMY